MAKRADSKQLLDFCDIWNNQGRGKCYQPKPKAEANNTNRTNIGEHQKAKQYMQLQNKFLNYKHQLQSLIPEATIPTQPQESNQISTNVLHDRRRTNSANTR